MFSTILGLRKVHVACLIFLGRVTNYMLRVNLNLTIEYMTSQENNNNFVAWPNQQEDIEGAFFIGYFILQVPGGRLAEIFGTKRIFGYFMFVCAIAAALTPVCSTLDASASFPLVYTLRIVQGLAQSVCFSSLHPLTSKWSPEKEKGKFVSFFYLGDTFGSVVISLYVVWSMTIWAGFGFLKHYEAFISNFVYKFSNQLFKWVLVFVKCFAHLKTLCWDFTENTFSLQFKKS